MIGATFAVALAIAVMGSLFFTDGRGKSGRANASTGDGLTVSQQDFDPFGPLTLAPGFNNIVYTGPDLFEVRQALNDAADSVTAVWAFRVGEWSLWSASLPEALQGFRVLVFGEPYFVVAEREAAWTRLGFGPVFPTSATLQPGLNHVGYWGDTLPIADLLARFQPTGLAAQQAGPSCVNLIWSFDTQWRLWEPSLPTVLLGFTELVRGRGYFIDVSEPCQFDFPGTPAPEPGENRLDFGDAPQSYGTVGEGSAVHNISGPFWAARLMRKQTAHRARGRTGTTWPIATMRTA